MMIRRRLLPLLLQIQIPKTLTPSSSFSTFKSKPHRNNNNNNNKNRGGRRCRSKTPEATPPFSQSELDGAISRLPPRFTPSDLSSLISSLSSSPLIAYNLFLHSSHLPRFHPPHPSPFLTLIPILSSHPHLHHLLDSVASLALSSLPPSLPLFNSLLHHFARSRSLSKAVYVYNRLRDSPSPDSKPNLQTYHLMLEALIFNKAGGGNTYINHAYMDAVRLVFKQMVNSGVKPDVRAMNYVVKGYVGSLHLNDALRVFHQFEEVYGVRPDGDTYDLLVHGLCAQGRTRNAVEMYGEMKGKGMVVGRRAGNSLVSALAMGGEVGEAVGVMWEVVGMGRGMDEITVRTVVEGVLGKGGREEAMGLVRELRERELVDGRVYRELMNGIEDGFGAGGGGGGSWDY